MKLEKCILCNEELIDSIPCAGKDKVFNKCQYCGNYSVNGMVIHMLKNGHIPDDKKWILSGFARLRSKKDGGIVITRDNVNNLIDSAPIPNGPIELIDRILLYLYENMKDTADFIKLTPSHYPIAFAKNKKEFSFLLNEAKKFGYINQISNVEYSLTIDGWKRVSELKERKVISDQAFIAMWFSEEMDSIWEKGFKPALKKVGYNPVRIDSIEHNDKIDDKIISEIKRSGILIADFTGQRGGVYFEAGYAMGIGIPVIWTCKEDDVKGLHFDTRQYNHIVWKDVKELYERLVYRIEATIKGK